MATDTNTRAGTMCNGAASVVVEVLIQLAEAEARAEARLPGVLVHAEVLEILKVDHDSAIFTSCAKVASTVNTQS